MPSFPNNRLNPEMSVVFRIQEEKLRKTYLGKLDNESETGILNYGDYGEACYEVKKASGKKENNIEFVMNDIIHGGWTRNGAVSNYGEEIYVWMDIWMDFFTDWISPPQLMKLKRISEEELSSLLESLDSVNEPRNHYKVQPKFTKGKFIWISGPPGFGKSTIGLYLSKMAEFVYYEADCFERHVNPYIPPNVDEPSLATIKQKPLKGVSKERIDIVNKWLNEFIKEDGKEQDDEIFKKYYSALCENIKAEKKRIGGNWAVAGVVFTKAIRDLIKRELGQDLIFVLLNMSIDEQKKRIMARHGENYDQMEWLLNRDRFEPATEEEMNIINIDVTSNMDREDVVKTILERISRFK